MKKEYRIKKGSEIERIMKQRQSIGSKYFVIYQSKTKNHDQSHFRFAVSVSKKFGNAVKRNKIKRQIREIIAHCSDVKPVDFFIVVKVPTNELAFTEIEKELHRLMKKQEIMR
jgi:ribonuclease P protein component